MLEQIDFHQPISTIARHDVLTLNLDSTVQQALDHIRSHGLGERIVYFYVVDEDRQLKGVIPTRRLLTAPLAQRVSDLMIKQPITVPQGATILEAYELLVRHKFLALPVVDRQQHILGVVDVDMFADENFRAVAREQVQQIFETIGFHISEIQDASPVKSFFLRFRWLIPTIGSGIVCAVLAGCYELTLARSLLLAFFLTLVLGLGESVSMQSMAVTVYALRSIHPTLRWYAKAFWRELRTALLLGAACGLVVGTIAALTHGAGLAAVVIGTSILVTVCAACLFGLSVPAFLHAIALDPKIAAGPLTLAIADICTIIIYFSLAAMLL